MEIINPVNLTLTDLETELSNIAVVKKETNDFLEEAGNLSDEKISELEKLKKDIELLKSLGKIEKKQDYIKFLNDRELHIKAAIKTMKENGKDVYNPMDMDFNKQ